MNEIIHDIINNCSCGNEYVKEQIIVTHEKVVVKQRMDYLKDYDVYEFTWEDLAEILRSCIYEGGKYYKKPIEKRRKNE